MATARYLEALTDLTDEDVRAPSLLPGWTRGHVITHLARNADALANLLHGAADGRGPGRCTPSQEQRDADIEAGAGRSAAELARGRGRGLRPVAARRPTSCTPPHLDALSRGCPGGETLAGAPRRARMRRTEVEVHHADLGIGYTARGLAGGLRRRTCMKRRQRELDRRTASRCAWRATDTGEDVASRRRARGHGHRRRPRVVADRSGAGEGLACSDGRLPELGRWADDVPRQGQPAVRRTCASSPSLIITKMSVGDFDNNTYLLRCRRTDEQLLIDAAAELARILTLVGDGGLVEGRHHPPARRPLARRSPTSSRRRAPRRTPARTTPRASRCPPTSRWATATGSRSATASSRSSTSSATRRARSRCSTTTPTGTPHLFTGDCLFPGGVGNTFGNAEDFPSLLHDVPDQALRPAAGRDLVLPRPRRRLDARRRARRTWPSGRPAAGERGSESGQASAARWRVVDRHLRGRIDLVRGQQHDGLVAADGAGARRPCPRSRPWLRGSARRR